ncbi:hypothetical protein ACWOAH_11285 [Vagococcus vulneris]|uniref:Uncharacterized protein n=1 Tax=Vagococcus vulneris TaxID=1977869 RepID=A0A429ZQR3_9ENTE|nr:hypothetical protein [Vagococcus vulneris]RST96011.1 hypothetical protein CBF37_11240 [Vagococcus vulneris]
MKLEEKVSEHEKKLIEHDAQLTEIRLANSREIADIRGEIKQWNATLNEGLTRVDESNKYLREQNGQILNAIIGRNEKSSEREYELSKLKWSNAFKLGLAIFGSSGLVYAVIDIVLKLTVNK